MTSPIDTRYPLPAASVFQEWAKKEEETLGEESQKCQVTPNMNRTLGKVNNLCDSKTVLDTRVSFLERLTVLCQQKKQKELEETNKKKEKRKKDTKTKSATQSSPSSPTQEKSSQKEK